MEDLSHLYNSEADGQTICSPTSLTVQPIGSGRFKRRTGPPQQISTSTTESITEDTEESESLSAQKLDSQHSSPAHTVPSNEEDDCSLLLAEPISIQENWPSISGGSSCNQQPLDLSNAVRNDDVAPGEVVLDLSLQRKSTDDYETNLFVTQPLVKKRKPNTCMLEKVLMNEYVNTDITGEQGIITTILDTPEAPLLTDFTIVSTSDIAASTEGLVFGLALPTSTCNSAPSAFTPIAIQSSQCTMSPPQMSHSVLSTAPSLFTVLSPSTSSMNSPSNQPALQVFDPSLPSEPFVISTENTLSSTECDLTTVLPEWTSADSANLLTITQPINPINPATNLPGHVILSEQGINQIALNAPIVNAPIGSELPCYTSALTLNDSLLNSYNITSNTVLIECTLALDVPGNLVPTAIALHENTIASSEPTQMVINHLQQQILSLSNAETVDPNILVSSIAESMSLSNYSDALSDSETNADILPEAIKEEITTKEETADSGTNEMLVQASSTSEPAKAEEALHDAPNDKQVQDTFTKNFMCNVCDKPFHSMKELGHHVSDHSDKWPYKCEFCLLLFGKPSALLDHRSTLHGVGKAFVCGACAKEFAYLCNLKHHQEELHPGQQCLYTEEEKGKLRPQNYNSTKDNPEKYSEPSSLRETEKVIKKEKAVENVNEELLTAIKMMGSDGSKLKVPDVCLGINQHYPSYKPPPFPYHNRSPAGSLASATNFTTHNIPQTFSTAIRCTKCGKSFDNMPELHKHILTCANASDKRRYTPKKNPIPLRHFAKAQNGVLSTTNATNGQNSLQRASPSNKPKPNYGPPAKLRVNSLNKRKKKMAQRAMSQKSKAASATNKVITRVEEEEQEIFVCPLCNREFTYRRSRTKHMAACPMKPTKEVKKKKDGGISITKENHVNLHTVGVISEEHGKRQGSDHAQKPRAQSSSLAKRQAILPVQTVLVNKKSKTAIEESDHSNQETTKLSDSPIIRTFNPSLRQYSKVQHGVKKTPIKITIVKPQHTQLQPKKNEPLSDQPWNGAARPVGSSLLQASVKVPVNDKQINIQDPVREKEKPIY